MKLPTDSFLTVNECCIRLGLFYKWNGKVTYLRTLVDRWIKSGELKSYCIARGSRKSKFLIDPRDLADFIAKREFKPSKRR